jgi:hypothetical protein
MKTTATKYGKYYREENNGMFCFITDDRLVKCPTRQGIIFQMQTLYQLNGKRKIN